MGWAGLGVFLMGHWISFSMRLWEIPSMGKRGELCLWFCCFGLLLDAPYDIRFGGHGFSSLDMTQLYKNSVGGVQVQKSNGLFAAYYDRADETWDMSDHGLVGDSKPTRDSIDAVGITPIWLHHASMPVFIQKPSPGLYQRSFCAAVSD